MLQHKSQKVYVVIHLDQFFDCLLFKTFLGKFDNLFPILQATYILILILLTLLVYLFGKYWQGFGLLPRNSLIILNLCGALSIYAFFYFLHFLRVGLLAFLFLVKVLYSLNVIASSNPSIFMQVLITIKGRPIKTLVVCLVLFRLLIGLNISSYLLSLFMKILIISVF
jgi:hypothetical protein